MLFAVQVLIFALSTPITASFTQTTCWGSNCIQQNSEGTWCYIPAAGATRATTCTGTSIDWANVLEKHLQQGLSIAYYNGAGDTFAGGADLAIGDNPGVMRLCMSGQSGDGNYQTTCVNVNADNQIPTTGGCTVIRAQAEVSDGCYDPKMNVPDALTASITPPPGVTITRPASTAITTSIVYVTQTQASSASSLHTLSLVALISSMATLLFRIVPTV
ncbi:hypothetical protein FA13DRAFT_1813299 [Coprinellus micaceus]|uniref:Secreted protein n=1 Tax=Coprinellus micaceus TaxID=71717 RepID=A0A4Y7TEB2_COPMI|nr:hypothetical protein FA13DRAFT_1813299 [Coprinellus micaceus]